MEYFKFLVFVFLNLICRYSAKIFEDYASFEGCIPSKNCRFERTFDKIAFYSRASENSCSDSNVDENFLVCLEGYFQCGYLPVTKNSTKDVVINQNSGVVLANGLDLGIFSESKLESMGFPSILIDRLRPYIGLKGDEAYSLLLENNFTLSETEGELIANMTNWADKTSR